MAIKSLKPPERGQTTYWDAGLPGFGVRVSQGGTKSFVVVSGINRQRETLGRYPAISLKQARARAKNLLAEITLGISRYKSIQFDEARGLFLQACQAKNKPNTVDYYRKRLDKHFRFGRKRLDDISKSDIMVQTAKIRTSESEKNHAFVVIRTFLNWAVQQQYLESSPISSMKPVGKRNRRERVLSERELGIVYSMSRQHPYPFGSIVSLLVLTGQRRSEIASLRWDWIDQDEATITIPASVTKNKRTHIMPIGDGVRVILERLPHSGDYLFPSRSAKGTVFNGWGKSKDRFDRCLQDVNHYTLHDLRRTFSTVHAQLGTPIHVTERLLNHASGTISGVAAIYNRHSYMDEMRLAISKYDDYLDRLVGI